MSFQGALLAKVRVEPPLAANDPPRPFRIELPPMERGLSQKTVARFDRLRHRLDDKAITPKRRTLIKLQLDAIERAAAEKRETDWLDQSLQETIDLALARGEKVLHGPGGKASIISHQPIWDLLESGGINHAQHDAGLEVISYYEIRMQGLGSQLGNLSPGAEHNNDRFVRNALDGAKKAQRIGVIERAVALECRHEPAALQMLRRVCEQGQSVRSFASGRAYERHVTALCMALDVADAVIHGR